MRHIIDPDLGRDIVSLGFVKNLEIDGGTVRFTIELTTPACPMKARFKEACETAVKALPGVEDVEVAMGAQQHRRPVEPGPNALETVDMVVAVSSCKGGVGKSTVAVHLARALLRQGYAVGLLDADIYGPSIPTLLATHNPQLYGEENMVIPVDVDGVKVMSLGFVLGGTPAIMRGPMVAGFTQQILRQTKWGKLDYLIIDLPPGTGDIQLTVVQQAALDGAIIVTTPQALSLVDVAKGVLMFEKVKVPVLGVVENMSSFTCDDCGKVHYPFGRSKSTLQERFGLNTLAELPIAADIADMTPDAYAAAFDTMAENVNRAVCARRTDTAAGPELSVEPGLIRIRWPDGQETKLTNYDVRRACTCALCIDETTGAPLLDKESVPKDIQVESAQQLGNYAVGLIWSDGHATGIYSWDLLRSLA